MADDVTSLETNRRLRAIEAVQTNMMTAMGLMIDTMQQQSNLLQEIATAVRDEPGESPVVKSLDELTEAVVIMGANVEVLAKRFEDLPDEISGAFEKGASSRGVAGDGGLN